MVNEICKYCKLKSCDENLKDVGQCPEILFQFLNFIESNFNNPNCNVDDFLLTKNIDFEYLSFITAKYYHCTPKRLIENKKLGHVLLLLKNDISQNQAVEAGGYSYPRTFQKAFLRKFGKNFSELKNIISSAKDKDKNIDDLINELWKKSRNNYG